MMNTNLGYEMMVVAMLAVWYIFGAGPAVTVLVGFFAVYYYLICLQGNDNDRDPK
ncbi:MAG: hypothetical protein KDA65_15365 [Planctomycetaceae bacterium]|nr:hypothetical protein [Planctomycetaceae bacterium]